MTSAVDNDLRRLADRWGPRIDYAADPIAWARDRLGIFLWSAQQRVMELVRDNRYVAVPSCHDVGKSYLAAAVACWWLDSNPIGDAFVVTTAPTDAQVKAILWREIGKMQRKGKLAGKVTKQAQWYMGPGDAELVAYGRKPADHVSREEAMQAFQGIHARRVLVVIDEGCGVPKWLFDASDALATNEHARVLVIGNPDDPGAHFAKVCQPGSGWVVHPISAFDSPNFTDEEIPDYLHDLLLSRIWVEERRKRWGAKNPLYQSKVLGLFPEVGDHNLIQPAWVLAAQNRTVVPNQFDSVLGVDVARFGSDETCGYLRQGYHIRRAFSGHGWPTTETAGKTKQVIFGNTHPVRAQVDDVGVGGGVLDQLVEDGFDAVGLNGGSSAVEKLKDGRARFVNARSEWYWQFRELLQDGLLDLDSEDEDLAAQLVDIRWGTNSKGQIWVEPKDEMKARGVDSPDRADGAVYSAVKATQAAEVSRLKVRDRRLAGRR